MTKENDNEISSDFPATPTTPPKKNSSKNRTHSESEKASSALPAMTQDFVEYVGADAGIDLTKYFQCAQYTDNDTSDSSLAMRRISNQNNVEKEVNGIFSLLEHHDNSHTSPSSSSSPSQFLITQPRDNCTVSKRASPQASALRKRTNLSQFSAGYKHRQRRQQRRKDSNLSHTKNHTNQHTKPKSTKRSLNSSKRQKISSSYSPSPSPSSPHSTQMNRHNLFTSEQNQNGDNASDEAFGSILNSIEQHFENLSDEKITLYKSPPIQNDTNASQVNQFRPCGANSEPIASKTLSNLSSTQSENNITSTNYTQNVILEPSNIASPHECKLLNIAPSEQDQQVKNLLQDQNVSNNEIKSLQNIQVNQRNQKPTNHEIQKEEFDDPFNNTMFNEETLLMMDNLVNQVNSIKKASYSQNISSSKPHKSAKAEESTPQKQNSMYPNPSNNKDAAKDDDSFGSMPDFDFEQIDKIIEQRKSLSSTPFTALAPIPPHPHKPIQNPLSKSHSPNSSRQYSSFSRYQVHHVIEDITTCTKTLFVTQTISKLEEQTFAPKNISQCSPIYLRGEWYRTIAEPRDMMHLVSISGQWKTDISALPITLHTLYPTGSVEDDLVLVMHPQLLMTPSSISEAVGCSRRAVIKSRLGSTGMTSKAAIIGTMRHDLFESCLLNSDFSKKSAEMHAHAIVQKHAETLLGCSLYDYDEAHTQLMQILSEVERFAQKYTLIGKNHRSVGGAILEGYGLQNDLWVRADAVHATEESVIVPELGLKGNVDVTFQISSKSIPNTIQIPRTTLMGVELKTGHNQNPQNAHTAQLALYSLMLRIRHGSVSNSFVERGTEQYLTNVGEEHVASHGGMLLYLNHKGHRALHVSSSSGEAKSLISHRNVLAVELKNSKKPRGILVHEKLDDEIDPASDKKRFEILPTPATVLPDLLYNSHQCNRCYVNRECMLFAKSSTQFDPLLTQTIEKSHAPLFHHYTDHLSATDLKYFREWDRLIDLEANASKHNLFKNWLTSSKDLEKSSGRCISGLEFDDNFFHLNSTPKKHIQSGLSFLVKFFRSPNSPHSTPLSNLNIDVGSQVVISVDNTLFQLQKKPFDANHKANKKRQNLHLLRGSVENISEQAILIRSSKEECDKVNILVAKKKNVNMNSFKNPIYFRLDKDELSPGFGTLRQNLISLFTKDVTQYSIGGAKHADISEPNYIQKRIQWLRRCIIHFEVTPVFDLSQRKSLFSLPRQIQAHFKPVQGCDFMDLAMEFSELNPDQRAAVEKVVTAQDFTLIQGLPGTGKTSTIAFVTRLLVARGKRVLVTSYTHAAVDNLMLKLIESGLGKISEQGDAAMIRVGRKSQCHPITQDLIASTVAEMKCRYVGDKDCKYSRNVMTAATLYEVMSSARIVGCSALTVPRSPLLVDQHFDVVIVDEAGQISQPSILGPLMAADSFVLVGDHMQLPPLVISDVAEQAGYGVSMLKRLAEHFPDAVAQLKLQYRMNDDICSLCNEIIYRGALKCANEKVKRSSLVLSYYPSRVPHPPQITGMKVNHWLLRCLSPTSKVIFLDTDKIEPKRYHENIKNPSNVDQSTMNVISNIKGPGLEEKVGRKTGGGAIINKTELEIVCIIVKGLITCGLDMNKIGILSPYRSQVRLLEEDNFLTRAKKGGLEISTIDRYQGKDKSVILFSLVRSNVQKKSGMLLNDFRRLNVAVSRAKHKLIMIGSYETLYDGSKEVMRPLLEKIKTKEWIESLLPNSLSFYNFNGFSGTKSENTFCGKDRDLLDCNDPSKKPCFYSVGSKRKFEISSQEIRDAEQIIGK